MGAEHHLVALITVLAVALCMWALIRVSLARARFGILAPATVGHPEFERHFRVHMNTLESLALFLPSLWVFAQYWSQWIAAGLGALWLAGRVIYMFGYVKDPKSRGPGFMIQGAATSFLLLGALAGIVRALFGAGY